MQIQKQISSPVDPNEPFLLSLPAEIRNQIYELLFVRDEPVLLHNAKVYYPNPPQEPHGIDQCYATAAFDEEYENENDQDHFFIHDFQAVAPALLVCRQMYAEAVGFLYSNNTFMFSRPLYRHDKCSGYFGYVEYDHKSYLVTNYVAQWLLNLGSQMELLKKVRIDTGALCPFWCSDAVEYISILELVRLLWKHPYLTDVVAFIQREPSEREKANCDNISHPEEDTDMNCAEQLQGILMAIGGQDVLNSKRYASMDLLVDDISLNLSKERGYITGRNLTLTFETPKDEAVRWLEMDKNSLGFLRTHRWLIMRKIFSLVTFPADQIVLDLDLRTVQGFNPILLQLNSSFRLESWPRMPKNMSVIIRKSISTTTSGFENLADVALELVSPTGRNSQKSKFGSFLEDIFIAHPSTVIILDFDIATATSLKEIRINIKDFMSILSHYSIDSQAKVRFVLKCPWGNAVHHEEATIMVGELLQSLFLLLTDIKLQWSAEWSKTRDSQLPDIWINGHGALISACYTARSDAPEYSVDYRHGLLTPTEIRNRGHRMAMTSTPYDLWDDRQRVISNHTGMLGVCWSQIRHLHYDDRSWTCLPSPVR